MKWELRDDVRFAEEVAKEYGFRMPHVDETLEHYQAALDRHLQVVFAEMPQVQVRLAE